MTTKEHLTGIFNVVKPMPENLIFYFISIFSAYLIGAVPWAYIIGKSKGIDIRQHGSGNVGATNLGRALGKKYAVFCFILDFLKGFCPVLAVSILLQRKIIHSSDLLVVVVAMAALCGHIWPVYLGFKGGKGVSTIAGILLAVAPFSLITAGIVWTITFYSSRYVSLASIFSAIILPFSAYIFSEFGVYSISIYLQMMLIIMSLLVIFKHKANIKRLLSGTENRIAKKTRSKDENCSTE